MGKLYEKFTRKNIIKSDNQEYEICTSDDFNDSVFRGYSQEPKYKKEEEIIKDIENGLDYRTDNNTIVVIVEREGKKYIKSTSNKTGSDNLLNLPTY